VDAISSYEADSTAEIAADTTTDTDTESLDS
jgi:hypothetical protein